MKLKNLNLEEILKSTDKVCLTDSGGDAHYFEPVLDYNHGQFGYLNLFSNLNAKYIDLDNEIEFLSNGSIKVEEDDGEKVELSFLQSKKVNLTNHVQLTDENYKDIDEVLQKINPSPFDKVRRADE